MNNLDILYENVLNEYSILEIYNDNEDFLNLINSLKIKILKELAHYPQITLLALLHNNEKRTLAHELVDIPKKYEQLSRLGEERKKIYEEFGNKRVSGLGHV